METPDDLRPTGMADVPLIQDDLLEYARELLEAGEVAEAERATVEAAELVAEVR